MEPEGATPVIEYVLAGEDAERICARGFVALAAAARTGQHAPDPQVPGFESWTFEGRTWRMTLPDNPAFPALVADRAQAIDEETKVFRTVCAYSQGLTALDFATDWGFSADEMHVANGRWETPK